MKSNYMYYQILTHAWLKVLDMNASIVIYLMCYYIQYTIATSAMIVAF